MDSRPLVLTNRSDHIERLASGLTGLNNAIIVKGGMGKKRSHAVMQQLAAVPEGTTGNRSSMTLSGSSTVTMRLKSGNERC